MSEIVDKAYAEIFAICNGKKWQMSLPVNEDKDSDCVIIAALTELEQQVAELTAQLEKRDEIEKQRKELILKATGSSSLEHLLVLLAEANADAERLATQLECEQNPGYSCQELRDHRARIEKGG